MVLAVGLAWVAGMMQAQEKGAELSMQLRRLNTVADVPKVEAGDSVVVSCPKCKAAWVSVGQPLSKFGWQETAASERHECPGCDTKMEIEGFGKQAKSVVKHVCKQCGAARTPIATSSRREPGRPRAWKSTSGITTDANG